MADIDAKIVIIRGGGDLATGVVQKFYHAGFHVAVLETAIPFAIRRTVALCSAVFDGDYQVEDMQARLVDSPDECRAVWDEDQIPVLIDPAAHAIHSLKPGIVVDCILAKKNLGTNPSMAPVTIALGPGFTAPVDVDVVIETMRGHTLGRLYLEGSALPNTGIPGELGGKSAERVIHAPVAGRVSHLKKIGAVVTKGEGLFLIDDTLVSSPLDGTLRGLIAEGLYIPKGLKCADVDPRDPHHVDFLTISDKARALGGAALDAALMIGREKKIFRWMKE